MKIFKFTKTVAWLAECEVGITSGLNCPGNMNRCSRCSWYTKGLYHCVFSYEDS